MNEVLNYCLNEIGCALPGFHVRAVSNEPVITPLAVAFAGEKVYFSAAKEIFAEAKKHIDEPGALYDLAARYARERGYEPPRADEIICYEVEKCAPSNSAVRLTGAEKDALFSDLPYLITLGPVFGIVKNGVVVSLAGAVDRGSVYEVHIETAPSERKKGFAAACLRSLAHTAEKPLLYRCRKENRASDSTVRSVGGVPVLSYRAFTARR